MINEGEEWRGKDGRTEGQKDRRTEAGEDKDRWMEGWKDGRMEGRRDRRRCPPEALSHSSYGLHAPLSTSGRRWTRCAAKLARLGGKGNLCGVRGGILPRRGADAGSRGGKVADGRTGR